MKANEILEQLEKNGYRFLKASLDKFVQNRWIVTGRTIIKNKSIKNPVYGITDKFPDGSPNHLMDMMDLRGKGIQYDEAVTILDTKRLEYLISLHTENNITIERSYLANNDFIEIFRGFSEDELKYEFWKMVSALSEEFLMQKQYGYELQTKLQKEFEKKNETEALESLKKLSIKPEKFKTEINNYVKSVSEIKQLENDRSGYDDIKYRRYNYLVDLYKDLIN